MPTPILLPDIGSEDQPVRVVQWLVDAGAEVVAGDRLLEVVCSGVVFHVSAPATGVLIEQTFDARATVEVGETLGVVRE